MRMPKIIKRVGNKNLIMNKMKVKVFLIAVAVCVGGFSAYACSHSECGSGNSKCCTDVWGATYYSKSE